MQPSFNPLDPFAKTPKHREAYNLLGSKATHILLYGGARSGKTFVICYAILTRAIFAPNSSHVIFRHHFNHLRSSIINDTMKKVQELCYPGLKLKWDSYDSCHVLPNGSRIYYVGLEDNERTEKILGNEYCTIYMNECSQISYGARTKAITRLAKISYVSESENIPEECHNQPLRLKCYYDCNPPSTGHWTYMLFKQHLEPSNRKLLKDPERYLCMQVNPKDNLPNLPPELIAHLETLPDAERRRFLDGEFIPHVQGALWTLDVIKREDAPDMASFEWEIQHRALLDKMKRIVVAVDPSGCSGPEDKRSDEVGIVVCGLGYDKRGYVLADLSGYYPPEIWGRIAVNAFDNWEADCIVAEQNYGGDMVRATVHTHRPFISYQKVTASRGKHVRAEPISALYASGRVVHVGNFVDLENQLMEFTAAGYMGEKSPDRADAMIWGLTDLMIEAPRGESSTGHVSGLVY